MSIDINELAPAPWTWEAEDHMLTLGGTVLCIVKCKACQKSGNACYWPDATNAEAITLMRSDLDVQMRRKWFVMPQLGSNWIVLVHLEHSWVPIPVEIDGKYFFSDHPLGLLTRTDEAMKKEGK